jgi:hypothetical protein
MLRKAKAGHVTGGACFGYRNVGQLGPDGKRSHVEREIEPAEADVIRRIFQLSSEGQGLRAIAKQLNDQGAPSPRAQQGRSQSWAPTSVRESPPSTALPRRDRLGANGQAQQVGPDTPVTAAGNGLDSSAGARTADHRR